MTTQELEAEKNGKLLKLIALEEGFATCRISKVEFLSEEAPKLEAWLKEEKHGKMGYMANHFDLRLNPALLVEGAKSLVSLVFHYKPEEEIPTKGNFRISKYAYGEDYHKVLRTKLKILFSRFQEQVGKVEGRVFVDSAPILEKAWAARNGTGWLGKHTNIIHPSQGSFFFLCEMILNLDLQPDGPVADHCGTCTRCIDACPTQAIVAPYQLDASRCISYLTIELKEAIPQKFKGKMDYWIFGCDVCQDVCPWNQKFSVTTPEPNFGPSEELKNFRKKDWIELNQEIFNRVFAKSAVKRTKFEGLKRNINFSEGKLAQ